MKRKKVDDHSLFKSIRKPTAPPTRKVDDDRPEAKVHPARRKIKHKKKDTPNGDL